MFTLDFAVVKAQNQNINKRRRIHKYKNAIKVKQPAFFLRIKITLVNVYVDLVVFTRIAGTS